MKFILLVQNKWNIDWYKNMITDINLFYFLNIDKLSIDEIYDQIINIYNTINEPVYILGYTESAMRIYISLSIKLKEYKLIDFSYLKGNNSLSYYICYNKYTTRHFVPECDSIKYQLVTNDKYFIEKSNIDMIFKPINSDSSSGIIKLKKNKQILNPFYQKNLISDDIITILINDNLDKKILSYFNKNYVGIKEEYINPESRKISVDGFVFNNIIHLYSISENIYYKQYPEKFNYLITPAKNISSEIYNSCKERYNNILNYLISQGLNNQFCDVEMFIIKKKNEMIIKIMEINCRCFSNQLPIFSMLYSDKSMFNIHIKLMQNLNPVIDTDFAKIQINNNKLNPQYGICLYRPNLNLKKSLYYSENNSIFYYQSNDNTSHIYIKGNNPIDMINEGEKFYSKLKKLY